MREDDGMAGNIDPFPADIALVAPADAAFSHGMEKINMPISVALAATRRAAA
jgi:hypothetical protein